MSEKRPPVPDEAVLGPSFEKQDGSKLPPEGNSAPSLRKRRGPDDVILPDDPEAQAEIRKALEQAGVLTQMHAPAGNPEAMIRQVFLSRLERMPGRVALAKSAVSRSAELVERLSTWDGYLAHLNSLTMAGVPREPTENDRLDLLTKAWTDYQSVADEQEGIEHALRIMQWASPQSQPMKAAMGALEQQLNEAKQVANGAQDALAKLEAIQGLPKDSPKLAEARENALMKAVLVRRFEIAIRAVQGGV